MKNIEDILESLGIEVPGDKAAELTKLVAENYKTISEHNKRVISLENERDSFREQYETAQKTLSKFENIDVDGVQKELAEYKDKVKELETTHKQALYDRDFSDALKNEIDKIKFSSEAAKKSVMSELKAAGLKLVDGKIMGFNDFISTYKEKDASAFVDEQTQELEKNKPAFSRPMQSNPQSTKSNIADLRTAMGLKVEKGE